MIVFRLSKQMYADDLSGKGAEIAAGRWNSRSRAMLYTSQSVALCVTEIAVHVPLGIIPENYMLIHIEIPDNEIFESKKLPSDWQLFPHSDSTQQLGDAFLKNKKFLVIKVPSAVVQGDFNYLINPQHPDFKKVKIIKKEKFSFDQRLFVR